MKCFQKKCRAIKAERLRKKKNNRNSKLDGIRFQMNVAQPQSTSILCLKIIETKTKKKKTIKLE